MSGGWTIRLELTPSPEAVPALRSVAGRLLAASNVAEADGVRVQLGLDEAAHALIAASPPRPAPLRVQIGLRAGRVTTELEAAGREMPERDLLARVRLSSPLSDPSLPSLRARTLRATCERVELGRSGDRNRIRLGYDVETAHA